MLQQLDKKIDSKIPLEWAGDPYVPAQLTRTVMCYLRQYAASEDRPEPVSEVMFFERLDGQRKDIYTIVSAGVPVRETHREQMSRIQRDIDNAKSAAIGFTDVPWFKLQKEIGLEFPKKLMAKSISTKPKMRGGATVATTGKSERALQMGKSSAAWPSAGKISLCQMGGGPETTHGPQEATYITEDIEDATSAQVDPVTIDDQLAKIAPAISQRPCGEYTRETNARPPANLRPHKRLSIRE